jgi:hypothetical protein
MAAKAPRKFDLGSTQPPSSVLDELTGGADAAPPAGAAAAAAASPSRRAQQSARVRAREPAVKVPRAPIRIQVPEDLADRVRGAVAALAYRDDDWVSLNAATAAALEQFVTAAEAEYNDGQPFPWQPGRQLQAGRRVGDRRGH